MLKREQQEFLSELKKQIGIAIEAKLQSRAQAGMGAKIPTDPTPEDRTPSPTHFFTGCSDFGKPDNRQSGPGGILG